MAQHVGKRVGALVMAGVFLFSSVALTGYVIWQIKRDKTDTASLAAQQAIKDQQAKAADASKSKDTTSKEGKLEGTKLADFTPVESISELSSTDLTVGSGDEVKEGDTITAHYTGALAKDGTIFQSSYDTGSPFTSPLSGLIKGWQQGIPGMKVGGKRRLMIPAALAYGSQAQSGIPANSDLVFDIELTATKH